MKPLTQIEKEKHHNNLDKFVKKINNYFLKSIYLEGSDKSLSEEFDMELKEVGYAVLLDSYHYFDFPYTEDVDLFNEDLARNEYLKGLDVRIHKRFSDLKSNQDIKGYIFYEYYLDEKSKSYHLINSLNNISYSNSDDDILKFLPIMDCAVSNKNTYLYKVYDNALKNKNWPTKQLLILSAQLGKDNEYSYDDNTLVSAFSLSYKDINTIILEGIAKKLYEEIFYLLECFFHSPILSKLLNENKKSYILGYKHNLQQLSPYNALSVLKKALKKNNQEIINESIENINNIFKVYDLTYHLMFDYEMVNAGYTDFNIKYQDLSLLEILQDFNKNYNDPYKKNIFDFKSAYFPVLDPKKSNYELFDFILLLWNLWRNSIENTTNDHIKIYDKKNENSYIFFFVNKGLMPKGYINYINDIDPRYPVILDEANPYPGLIIIKDIIKRNSKLSIKAILDEKTKETIIRIIIKN